jgi:ubiquinone/menaquinone biosynthesis C-methylase UbiE
LAKSGAKEILERMKSISGGKVLDVCTGSGDFIQALVQTLKDFVSFVGVDVSERDLEAGKKRFVGRPVEFRKMDASILEFEENSFDTVTMANSMHHLDEVGKALDEMKRVLKPGGYLIVNEPYCDGRQNDAQKTDMFKHHWTSEIDSLLGITHHYTFTKKEIKRLIARLGLKDLETLDSARYVKCLYCERMYECEDPRSENHLKDMIKEINEDLERLKTHPEARKLGQEGEKLKERVKKVGSADASSLFLIGTK